MMTFKLFEKRTAFWHGLSKSRIKKTVKIPMKMPSLVQSIISKVFYLLIRSF